MPHLDHIALIVRDYDEALALCRVAVWKDLYGNLWDLVEFAPGHPAAD